MNGHGGLDRIARFLGGIRFLLPGPDAQFLRYGIARCLRDSLPFAQKPSALPQQQHCTTP